MNLFKIFVPEEANDERSRAYLMVEVDSQGKSTGVYRWNLSGTDNLTVNVPLSDVIPLPQAEGSTSPSKPRLVISIYVTTVRLVNGRTWRTSWLEAGS